MAEASFLAGVQKATAVDRINSMIIFGEYGVGKTIFASSADDITEYSPVLVVDIEGSAAGIGRLYPNVDIIKVDSYEALELIRDELVNEDHPYKTVIFDTLNVAQNRAERVFKKKPENQNNKFAVWSDLKDWTLDFVREQHAQPYLAIFIAHTQSDKDDNTGKITTTVKIAGSARTDVPTVPDLIGYMGFETDDEGETISTLRVGRSTSIITKNRFGLDDVIYPAKGEVYPTIKDIQMAIFKVRERK